MELSKDEFFDVYREFVPDGTREEYEREWEDFQRIKARRLAEREVNG